MMNQLNQPNKVIVDVKKEEKNRFKLDLEKRLSENKLYNELDVLPKNHGNV
jgi:hypothetical protein